jgi:glycosyltransferase involved in cell wall biosynthesis
MKIAVDGTPLIHQRAGYLSHRTGVGHYTYKLLAEAMRLRPDDQYEIIGFRSLRDKLRKPAGRQLDFPGLTHRFVPGIPKEAYTRLLKRGSAPPIDRLVRTQADVFFYPNFVRFPQARPTPSVVVIYDLSFELFPNFATVRSRSYLQACVPRSIEQATKVVTISQSSKQSIIKAYGTDASKLEVIYPAVDRSHFNKRPESEIAAVRKRYKISGQYLLFTSTLEPRKNILGLIEAYASLPKPLQQRYSLVLAGAKGWLDDGLERTLNQHKDLPIKLLGYVDDADLPALYSGASLFVYPSFYEGFGMPPLEAMACAIPVITSDNSSLPEVVGEAGILINAKDTAQISNAIKKVLSDPELAKTLSEKGLAQAGRFEWQTGAKQLVKLFARLAQ